MFGFCQNVEIIHQHHHHFYEYTMPMHLKNGLVASKSIKTNPVQTDSPNYNRKNDPEAMIHTSKIYHSRRSYLNKNQKGIEVLCKVPNKSLAQDINELTESKLQSINAFNHEEQLFHPQFYHSYHQPQIRVINQVHFAHFAYPLSNQGAQHQSAEAFHRMQKSAPQVDSNAASQNSSSRTRKNYINSHKLRQSKIGMSQEGIYQTIKINRILPIKTQSATEVKIPRDADRQDNHSNLLVRSSHHYDRDSMLTKKSRVVNAMKTGLLLEEAKSIISHESLQNEAMQIEESIIVSRSMDYFCHITAQRQLGVCKIYLGMDCEIGLLVCIRLFEHRFQYLSFKEAELYNHLNIMTDNTGISFGVLELYKTLVEGTGEHKNIYFVLQPFQQMLDQFVEKRRVYFRSVPMAFSCFMQSFQLQMNEALTRLKECGLILVQVLQLKDIVLINNKFKLNSLLKLRKVEDPFASHNAIKHSIDHLKYQIEQIINR